MLVSPCKIDHITNDIHGRQVLKINRFHKCQSLEIDPVQIIDDSREDGLYKYINWCQWNKELKYYDIKEWWEDRQTKNGCKLNTI